MEHIKDEKDFLADQYQFEIQIEDTATTPPIYLRREYDMKWMLVYILVIVWCMCITYWCCGLMLVEVSSVFLLILHELNFTWMLIDFFLLIKNEIHNIMLVLYSIWSGRKQRVRIEYRVLHTQETQSLRQRNEHTRRMRKGTRNNIII